MSEASPRFQLPFIIPGQAQKELFHNEALIRLDAICCATAETPPLVAPPAKPEDGQCWIVAAGGTGAWSGRDDNLAMWSEGGWRFVVPAAGMTVWIKSVGHEIRWDGTQWSTGALTGPSVRIDGQQVVGSRQPHVPSPSGGTVIDLEARAAVDALIVALMSHGLID